MPGSLIKMKVPMIARTTTGKTVQMTSSFDEPWICGPSTVRGRFPRRYLRMKMTSAASTPTKMTPVKIETKMNAVWTRWAFGECASPGKKPPLPAYAATVVVRATVLVARVARAKRRTPNGIV